MHRVNEIVSTLSGFHLAAIDENKPVIAGQIKAAIQILESLEDYDTLLSRMDLIDAVWAYYIGAKGVGHTELMLHGALNYDGEAAIVVGASSEADRFQSLAQPDRHIVPYTRFDTLVGKQMPIAWDNHAIVRIFSSLSIVQSTFRTIKRILSGQNGY